ncbi:hypothetical protein C8J57DRAFT_359462 [Mycena rebaudengoi]|nr:hypothetical protein C8J57DRAFT_328547 [Mycena rebaudengoi]KAJ7267060.1 hypothetical protein C8J57DRAFT_359462 [Mycena rebaudengoi]
MPPVTTAESQEASAAAILKERRFKLSRACDRCRRRRIKCDEGHPCQACLAASSSCTFEEPGKRTHPHKSKCTATLEDRMHIELTHNKRRNLFGLWKPFERCFADLMKMWLCCFHIGPDYFR